MKVFVSWSGERSKLVARAWARFLPDILQNVEVFFSEDIDAGEIWGTRLDTELANTHHGILCLTHENKTAPWLLYEGGALSKHVGKARVWCYLHELTVTDVGFPLARFNLVTGDKTGAFKIVQSVNTALESQGVAYDRLQRTFEKFYPDFEAAIKAIPATETPPEKRAPEELLQELLGLVRGQSQSVQPSNPQHTSDLQALVLDDIRTKLRQATTITQLRAIVGYLHSFANQYNLPTMHTKQALTILHNVDGHGVTVKDLHNDISILLEDFWNNRPVNLDDL